MKIKRKFLMAYSLLLVLFLSNICFAGGETVKKDTQTFNDVHKKIQSIELEQAQLKTPYEYFNDTPEQHELRKEIYFKKYNELEQEKIRLQMILNKIAAQSGGSLGHEINAKPGDTIIINVEK